ncbi:terminase gpA endonuclease subunit [Escherichia coli]
MLLTDVFHKTWPLASDPDVRMRLMAMAVDTGGEAGVTDNAYRFWRRCRSDGLGNRVFLFKGDGLRRDRLALTVPSRIIPAEVPAVPEPVAMSRCGWFRRMRLRTV